MAYENIVVTLENGVAVIRLNRPKAFNALCKAVNEEMEAALKELRLDQSVRVLIITGGEKVFAAGADIKEMLTANSFEALETSRFGHYINELIEQLPFPVIASVCGPALGGGLELALACDFRVLGESAKLGLPEVGLGILPGAGGTQRLVRLVGASKAKELIMLGSNLKAADALALGLATCVAPDDQVWEETQKLATKLIQKPAAALMLAKRAVNCGEEYGLAAGKIFENILFGLSFSSQDQAEGMTAFLERRPPNYSNAR